jgi:hypothetical protein
VPLGVFGAPSETPMKMFEAITPASNGMVRDEKSL